MAAKARRARLTNLKRSFVVTVAAGLSGCAGVHSDDGPATMAGSGGAGSGGAGGMSGLGGFGGVAGISGVGSVNPPFVDTTCPIDEPDQDASCTATEPCTYDYPNVDPCFPSMRAIAICQDGQWVVATSTLLPELACNPPPPELDSGVDPGFDEDAGR